MSPPSLLLRTLERLNIRTVGDAADLGLGDLRDIPGVGRLKAAQLRDLVRAARDWTGDSEASESLEEDTDVDHTWTHVRPDDPWRTTLARLSNKAKAALEKAEFQTLADVKDGLETLRDLPAVGKKTAEHVREHFERLTQLGTEIYLFGDAGVPRTVEELLQRAFGDLDERERDMVNRHELGEETLEEIGQRHNLTRERVRQVISRRWLDLVHTYAEVGTDLLAPEIAKLERPGQMMVCRTIDEAKRLDLAIQLTGYNPPRHKRVLSKNEREAFDQQITALRAALEDTGATSLDLEEALDVAENVGIMIERDELMRLMEDHWKVTFHEGRVVFPWTNIGDVLADVLLDLGHASDVRQILDDYDRWREQTAWADLPELNEHSARSHMARTDKIWSMAHGLYIHEDRLPFPIADLHAAVEWAIEFLEGRTDAIGANVIVDEMTQARVLPPGMTPHLLKDGIYRHPLGQTFKNNLLVARSDSFTDDGVTMADRIKAVLDGADEPQHWRAVARAMRPFGYANTSVMQLLMNDPHFVGTGAGHYTTLAQLGFSAAQRDDLIEACLSLLPSDGQIRSSDDIFAALDDQTKAAVGVHSNAVEVMEWVARLDGRVDAAHGLMARGEGGGLVRAAVLEVLNQMGVAYPQEVRKHLEQDFGYRGAPGNINVALAKHAADGRLLKLPGSLYSVVGKTEAATWSIWERRRELVISTASHADAMDYDATAMWSLICYVERLVDDDDLAATLLVDYLKRTDLSTEQRQNASDLKFALSMGMG